MRLYKCLLMHNRWYTGGHRIQPVRIVVHSSGANNKELRRYVNPYDGQTDGMGQILPTHETWGYYQTLQKIGRTKYGNHWNQTGPGYDYGMHAWIGALPDGTVAACQTLPWDRFLWGCGSGANGSYNSDAIQFEICEDTTDPYYTESAYQVAVELCAWLCKTFNLPSTAITSHIEAHAAGYASNHQDPMHWWGPKGLSMDQLRADVRAILQEPHKETPEEITVRHCVEDAGINQPDLWLKILKGQATAYPWHIKAILDKYHDALKTAKE